MYPADPDCREI